MSRRFPPKREYYVSKGARKFSDRQSTAVVYTYEKGGYFQLIGFHGKAQKPDFHYRYPSKERREAKAREHFQSIRDREARAIADREKRNAEGHGLELGSILRCSWGYDQTNIDYYEVTKLLGRKKVEIREIAQATSGDGWTGKCVPLPGEYTGKPMTKMAHGGSVKVYSFAHAHLVEPEIVGGVPTYQPSSWTAYA